MKRIKIMFFVFSLGKGGVQRFLVNLVNNLDKNKYDVCIVLVEKKGIYLDNLPYDIEVVDLNAKRVYFALIPLIKTLKKYKPDILFSIDTTINMVAILARIISNGKCKLIIRQAVEINKFSTKGFKRILAKLLYPKVDKCVVLTNEMKKNIKNTVGLKDNKMEVIYNAIDVESITNRKKDKLEDDAFKQIKTPKVIAVGRLTKQKNYLMLLEAFEVVLKEKDASLVIIGEGEDQYKIEEKVKEKGIENKVYILGFKDNPYKYMYNCDVFVLPSIYEGLSNALLEALACDIPIVTTNNPDNIIKDGVNGYQVDLSAQSIANGLIKLLNKQSLRNDITRNNNNYMNHFNISAMVDKYEQLFNKFL